MTKIKDLMIPFDEHNKTTLRPIDLTKKLTSNELEEYLRLPITLRILVENCLRGGFYKDAQNVLTRCQTPIRLMPDPDRNAGSIGYSAFGRLCIIA